MGDVFILVEKPRLRVTIHLPADVQAAALAMQALSDAFPEAMIVSEERFNEAAS